MTENQNIKAQYVRLIATESGATWIAVREFDVDAKVFYNAKVYTNVDALKNLGANVYEESAYLAALLRRMFGTGSNRSLHQI